MENNKPLYIPDHKKWKGLTVYCYRCKTNVSEICKVSGQSIKLCKHGEKHVFKVYVHVPGTDNQRKTKKLETRDINEAIKQAIEFEQEVKENKQQIIESKENKPEIKEDQTPTRPNLLIHAFARYIGWLHNEDVPAHLRKERSRDHIKDVERSFTRMAGCLKDNGYNLNTLTVDGINDNLVGDVFSYLEKSKFSNRSFNKYFSYYTSFLKWYAEEYNSPIRNWFERVKRKKLNPKPEAITQKEYEDLIKQIIPENGIIEYNGVKPLRNLYRPWLADGIRLALETGRRREEVINLKWNNIQESEGTQVIKVEDYKVNRIQHRTTSEEKKFIYIPVTDSLRKLLVELDYPKYRNTDNFILAPNEKINRKKGMAEVLSRGFTHYYNQLNTGRKLTFKSLRKAYITNLEIFMGGGNTKTITGHTNDQVIETNYIDKKEIAKSLKGFNVFSKETDRTDELKGVRTKTKKNIEQRNLEV
jgi:integrase